MLELKPSGVGPGSKRGQPALPHLGADGTILPLLIVVAQYVQVEVAVEFAVEVAVEATVR